MFTSQLRSASFGAVVCLAACSSPTTTPPSAQIADSAKAIAAAVDSAVGAVTPLSRASLGKIPVLMVHVVADSDATWQITKARFRQTLDSLYAHNYRPITVAQMIDKRIDVPAGKRPVVFTFDDASPSQFRYLDRDGQLQVDPASAVGIWLDFAKSHPDWKPRATFCMLSGAAVGRSFFGDKAIEGQLSAWRFQKLRFLRDQGFELCNHTLWHANLAKYPDAFVQEQIARGQLAIDSAVPGYRVRTFALPLGIWPKNRALALQGEWRNPKGGVVTRYNHDALLEVANGPSVSPFDTSFNARSIKRFNVYFNSVDSLIARLERTGNGYVVPASR